MDIIIISLIVFIVFCIITFFILINNTNYRKPLNYYEETRNKHIEKELEVEEEVEEPQEETTHSGFGIKDIITIMVVIGVAGIVINYVTSEMTDVSSIIAGAAIIITILIRYFFYVEEEKPKRRKKKMKNNYKQERNTYENIRDEKIKTKLGVKDTSETYNEQEDDDE